MNEYKYECLLNNFLALDFNRQLEILALFNDISNSKIKKRLSKQFENYSNMLNILVNSLNLYSCLNSTKRRYLRYRILNTLEDEITYNEWSKSNYNRNEIYSFLNKSGNLESFLIGLYDDMLKRYFKCKNIPDNLLELVINQFLLETDKNKEEKVEEFSDCYLDIDSYEGYQNKAIEMYDSVIKKLIGEDLFEYYQLLPVISKYQLIKEYCYVINDIINIDDSKLIIENKEAVRQKKNDIKEHKLTKT